MISSVTGLNGSNTLSDTVILPLIALPDSTTIGSVTRPVSAAPHANIPVITIKHGAALRLLTSICRIFLIEYMLDDSSCQRCCLDITPVHDDRPCPRPPAVRVPQEPDFRTEQRHLSISPRSHSRQKGTACSAVGQTSAAPAQDRGVTSATACDITNRRSHAYGICSVSAATASVLTMSLLKFTKGNSNHRTAVRRLSRSRI